MATKPRAAFHILSHQKRHEGKRKKGDGSWGRHSDRRAPGGTGSARCVRRLDGSLVPAIRITYRVSLRSSSSREPRYPSTGVVSGFLVSLFFLFELCDFHKGKDKDKYIECIFFSFFHSKERRKKKKGCVLSGVNKGWTPPLLQKRKRGDSHISHQGHARLTPKKNQPQRVLKFI